MFAHYPFWRPLILGGLFFASIFFIPTSAYSKTKTIRHHHGGGILKINREVNRAIRHGTRVRITGRCMSACTLYLRSKKVCVTQGASFKFHQAQFGAGPRYKARPDMSGTNFLMAKYPPRLRSWIRKRGGLPWKGWLTLNASTAVRYGIVKYC